MSQSRTSGPSRPEVIESLRAFLLTLLLVPFLGAAASPADSSEGLRVWTVIAGDETRMIQAKNAHAAGDSVLVSLRRAGHYFARIDSIDGEAASGGRIHVTPGLRYQIHEIDISGADAFDERELRLLLKSRPGSVLDPALLEEDVRVLLDEYERAGHPLASVEISAVELVPDVSGGLRVLLEVDEGIAPVLQGVAVEGNARTRPGYLQRVAGLRMGRPLDAYRPQELVERLEATGFYRFVGMPHIRVLPDSGAILVFPLEENAPGSFDLVLGFLPPSGPNEALAIVGNGHLELNNLFGGGRELALRLNRLPRQTSTVAVRLADPFIFGLPLGAEAQFDGLQQDSAYTKQRYSLGLGVRLAAGMHGFVSIGREFTRPGIAANEAIRRSEAWFAGVGIRLQRLDYPLNPTRGHMMEVVAESGRRNRAALSGSEPGQPVDEASVDQERVRIAARLYRPLFRRAVVVAGVDAGSILRGVADQTDLLRFGGATTLRGYDEDRFLARTAGRALLELRYLLDRESFAFAFFDAGYVDVPQIPGVQSDRGFYPGYGIGMRFSTGVGLVSASYAMGSEAGPANGRIHVGLSFGL